MHSGTHCLRAGILAGGLVVLAAGRALSVDGVFTNLSGGGWTNAANWSNGIIATGAGSSALFNSLSLSASTTVTLDAARTNGFLSFDDKATNKHTWTLNRGGAGALTLDTASGSPAITNAVTTVLAVALAGTKGMVKSGSGLLALANTNTYSGVTLINSGTLDLLNGQALGSSSVTIANVNGAILQLDGGITVSGRSLLDLNTQSGANGLQAGTGSNTWTGPVTLGSSGARLGAATNSVLNITGIIDSGSNVYDLRARGQQANPPGILILSATNTYGGNTLVNVGTLQLGNSRALPAGTVVQLGIGAGGSCIFDLAGFSPLVSGLADMPSQTFFGLVTNSSGQLSLLTVSNNTPNSYSGVIGGNLALAKLGSDTLSLAGPCTYTGPTTVSSGTLLIAGSLAAGTVTVSGGGVLGGSGSIGGAVTVQGGGVLAPGNDGIATLTINNALTLNSGSTTVIDIDKNNVQRSDQITGMTAVNAAGTLQVNNIGAPLLAAGDIFQTFTAAAFNGQFSSVSPAHPNNDPTLDWDTNQLATLGRLVIITNGATNVIVSMSITNSTGLTASVDSTGSYSIKSAAPAWTFIGNLNSPATNLAINTGTDNLGGYSEISFAYGNSSSQASAIRAYSNQPTVLFSTAYLEPSTNNLTFPRFTLYPANLYHLSFGNAFGIYDFNNLYADSPWLFFDTNFNAFLISPATNFMVASDTRASANSPIACGINSAITNLPSGFTHRAILVIQNGINGAFQTWGNALTFLSGKSRPPNDAAVELNKLGYWTDNGAVYYYNFDANKGYAGTLLAVRDEFAAKGLPLGYLQLDSWWYPKSYLDTWQGGPTNNRGGIFLYQAAPDLFTNGLAAFQQQLGLPLVTHARWIDDTSPYRTNYNFSLNVPIDLAYWTNIIGYISGGGVVTYEQDWLNQEMLPAMNLNDPPAYMNEMASAAASNAVNLQYCLPLPRHYLQGSLYNNLLTMRVSDDHFTSDKWDSFLYDSRFVSALGAWPWCDVFMSAEERNLVISTLSAGIVGVGDALGAVNVTNLFKAARPDAVLVKPDTPLLPLDASYLNDAQGKNAPLVASTCTDHNGLKAFYVFSYARQATNTTASFLPTALGVPGNAYVYDYFNHAGTVVTNGNSFTFSTTLANASSGGSYFIVVPIGPSGIGLLGDTNKYISLGKKRISDLSDSGALRATLQFAVGETDLTLSGYAPSTPFIAASTGSVASVAYDSTAHIFSASIQPGVSQTATLTFTLRPVLQLSSTPSGLQLSWPAVPVAVLERATTLSPPNWTQATNQVVTSGGQSRVLVDTSIGSAAFFRLSE